MKLLLETKKEIMEFNTDVRLNLDTNVVIQAKITGEEIPKHELLLAFDELVGVPAFQIMIEEMGRQLPRTGDIAVFDTSNKVELKIIINSITYSKDKMVILCDMDIHKVYCVCENITVENIVITPNVKIIKWMRNGEWTGEASIQTHGEDGWMVNDPIKFNYCPICGRLLD